MQCIHACILCCEMRILSFPRVFLREYYSNIILTACMTRNNITFHVFPCFSHAPQHAMHYCCSHRLLCQCLWWWVCGVVLGYLWWYFLLIPRVKSIFSMWHVFLLLCWFLIRMWQASMKCIWFVTLLRHIATDSEACSLVCPAYHVHTWSGQPDTALGHICGLVAITGENSPCAGERSFALLLLLCWC
jgi:hypothetical protein